MISILTTGFDMSRADELSAEMHCAAASVEARAVPVDSVLDCIAEGAPAAVVVDGSVDGEMVFRVTRNVAETGVPVYIAVSGDIDPAFRAHAAEAGAVDVIGRPVDMELIVSAGSCRKPAAGSILGLVSDAILVRAVNDDGGIGELLYANDAAASLIGVSKFRLKSTRLDDIAGIHRSPALVHHAAELAETGETRYRTEITRANGSIVPVEVRARQGMIGGRLAVVSTIREISDIVRQELLASELYQQVIKSREYYFALLHTFPGLIIRFGLDGSCDYVNRTWLDFTGRSLMESTGSGWRADVHPADADTAATRLLEAFGDRRRTTLTFRLKRHDGAYRRVECAGMPLVDEDGTVDGYFAVVSDVEDIAVSCDVLSHVYDSEGPSTGLAEKNTGA